MTDPMPVQPTAHYTMGGVPTNKFGQVVIDASNTVMPGFYAAGEVACVSVHGANRLGTNSLLDLIVFGKHAGLNAAAYAKGADFQTLPGDAADFGLSQLNALRTGSGGEKVADISKEMKAVMFDGVGIFRTNDGMADALAKVRTLRQRFKNVRIADTGKVFNTELLNAWELGNLLDLAEVVALSALTRTESRGGHAREDYPQRDDANWMKHTLAWRQGDDGVQLGYKPVVVTRFQPKERTY